MLKCDKITTKEDYMLYILSQVSTAIALIIDFVGMSRKTKFSILLFNIFATIFYVLCYVLLFSPVPAIFNFLCIVRQAVFIYLDKKNMPTKWYSLTSVMLIVLISITVGVFWSSPLDLFMIISTILLLITQTFKNTLVVRIGLISNKLLWLFYNLSLSAYVNVVADIVLILPVLYALIRYNIKHKEKDQFAKTTDKIIKIIKEPINYQ